MKWYKKNRTINVGCIVKCGVKIDKVAFELLKAKKYSFTNVNALRRNPPTYRTI